MEEVGEEAMAAWVRLARGSGVEAEPVVASGGSEDEEGEGGQLVIGEEPCEDMGAERGEEEELKPLGGQVGLIEAVKHPLVGEAGEGMGREAAEELGFRDQLVAKAEGEPLAMVVAALFVQMEPVEGNAEGAGLIEEAVGAVGIGGEGEVTELVGLVCGIAVVKLKPELVGKAIEGVIDRALSGEEAHSGRSGAEVVAEGSAPEEIAQGAGVLQELVGIISFHEFEQAGMFAAGGGGDFEVTLPSVAAIGEGMA